MNFLPKNGPLIFTLRDRLLEGKANLADNSTKDEVVKEIVDLAQTYKFLIFKV